MILCDIPQKFFDKGQCRAHGNGVAAAFSENDVGGIVGEGGALRHILFYSEDILLCEEGRNISAKDDCIFHYHMKIIDQHGQIAQVFVPFFQDNRDHPVFFGQKIRPVQGRAHEEAAGAIAFGAAMLSTVAFGAVRDQRHVLKGAGLSGKTVLEFTADDDGAAEMLTERQIDGIADLGIFHSSLTEAHSASWINLQGWKNSRQTAGWTIRCSAGSPRMSCGCRPGK